MKSITIAIMNSQVVPTRHDVRIPLVAAPLVAQRDNLVAFSVKSDGPPTQVLLGVQALDRDGQLTQVEHCLKGAIGPARFVNMSCDGLSAIVKLLVNVRAESIKRYGIKKLCSLQARVTAILVRTDTKQTLATGFVTCTLVPKHSRVKRETTKASRKLNYVCRSLTQDRSTAQLTPPASPQKRRRLVDFVAGKVVSGALGKRALEFE